MFPLFRNHLDLAHSYWSELIAENDVLIDATCGNGHDTLFLARLHPRLLYAIDLQERALLAAKEMLRLHLSDQNLCRVKFILGSHVEFPKEIPLESVKLIVYNLGYLPGGDKSITTLTESSLRSLQNALALLLPGGVVSLTCYPGHDEGRREEEHLLEFAKGLDAKVWSCCHHRWINRRDAPSLLLIQKIIPHKVS